MRKVNITNCYCLFLTVMMIATVWCSMERENILNERCDYLEKQIETIKNEAESNDCNQFIQLHRDNK